MIITKVKPDSLGDTLELKPGDRLLKIDNRRVQDIIDYHFRMTAETVLLDIETGGVMQQFEIEKEYDEDLGVEFEDMKIRSCANDCVFCFVDQNPKGLRPSLYFRDGDYRMSYLHGHYITMTNMGPRDLQRVVEQRLSPLYVSVHVTDPAKRRELFLHHKDDHLLQKLEFLTSNGIEIHSQVVLMPTLNDGRYLNQTLKDLFRFFPMVRTASIVPVGLTGHRGGLRKIPSVDREYAVMMTDQYHELQSRFPVKQNTTPFVLLSDEWYIQAQREFPVIPQLENIDLTENGVGQVRAFMDHFKKDIPRLPKSLPEPVKFTIFSGTLVNEIMEKEVGTILNGIPNLSVQFYPIYNDFFGHSVTVTGLLTGRDIIRQLSGKDLGQAVWSTSRILNDDGSLTLDDVSPAEMSDALGVPVNTAEDSILEIFERNILG